MLLRELQISFKHAILNFHEEDALNAQIHQNGLDAKKQLQIYQNNIFFTLKTALKNIYPVIYQIIGESLFSTVTRHYMVHNIPISGDINSFGRHFDKFLADFPSTRTAFYLQELACLEWAYHEVFHEEEVDYFNLDDLKKIPTEKYGRLKFTLNPACRLLSFKYSILLIWKSYYEREMNKTPLTIYKKAEKILIMRQASGITLQKIKEGEFAFLSAFSQSLTFKKSYMLALNIDMAFNIATCLKQYVLQKVIVGFY